jgi:hypothetical protein
MFLFCGFVLFSAGCGKKTAPPPPKVRSDLVLSLYDSMRNRRHDDALRKIERLREIAPSDVFLANLETLEKNNAILTHTQLLIDKGDLKAASEFVSDGIIKYGRHPELMAAKRKLDVANQINAILKVFRHPRDAKTLKKNALLLRKIASTYKPAGFFAPLASQEMKEAAKLDEWEKKCAVEGLCSQIASLLESDDVDSDNLGALYAVLDVADHDNEVVKEYREYISGKSNKSLNVYQEEDIFDSLNPPASKEPEEDMEKTKQAEEKDDNTKTKELKEEKKESGGWWKKFSF